MISARCFEDAHGAVRKGPRMHCPTCDEWLGGHSFVCRNQTQLAMQTSEAYGANTLVAILSDRGANHSVSRWGLQAGAHTFGNNYGPMHAFCNQEQVRIIVPSRSILHNFGKHAVIDMSRSVLLTKCNRNSRSGLVERLF